MASCEEIRVQAESGHVSAEERQLFVDHILTCNCEDCCRSRQVLLPRDACCSQASEHLLPAVA